MLAPGPEIVATHDGGSPVSGGVQASDRPIVSIHHLGVSVGDEATARADVAGHDLDGVERGLVDGSEARVHPVVGIPQGPVVGGLTSPVDGVDALRGVLAEFRDRIGQTRRVDVAHPSEILDCPGLLQ